MELRQLRYFLAVADARSFVSAAQNLYISRQAISKSVSQLEEELGVELFMRDSSGAFMTPAGILFYERVRTAVMELDSVRSQMQSYGTRYHQRIRIAFAIGTMPLVEQTLLSYRENQYNADIAYEEHPESECQKLLLEHGADIVITTAELRDPLFITEPLLRSPFGILIRPQAELQEVSTKDLSWIPLAAQNGAQMDAFSQKHGVSFQYRGYDLRRLLELTASGKCALVIPRCLVPENVGQLQWLPLPDGGFWQLYCSYSRSVEKNMLFSTALEDLHEKVFRPLAEREERQ